MDAGEQSRPKEQLVQRPWGSAGQGRRVGGTPRRPTWWLKPSEREERGEGHTGSCRAWWAAGRAWALIRKEVRALQGCAQRMGAPDPGAHGRPLVAASGRTAWGNMAEGTALAQVKAEGRSGHIMVRLWRQGDRSF